MGGDLECDGKPTGNCKGLRRVTTLLRYHHSLMGSAVANPGRIFGEFCDISYPKRTATNDYVHYIQKHSDNASRRQIAKELDLKCTNIGHCVGSKRHYGRNEAVSGGLPYHSMLEQFDTLHFNLCHVEEAGFRLAAHDVVDAAKVEEEGVDAAMETVTQRVRALKTEFDAERWNGGGNGKFNIAVQTEERQKNKGIFLKRSSVNVSNYC